LRFLLRCVFDARVTFPASMTRPQGDICLFKRPVYCTSPPCPWLTGRRHPSSGVHEARMRTTPVYRFESRHTECPRR
jgi:hypothetical protein